MIERVGEDVARELSRFGPATGLARLVDAWPAAVGPEIARNAWPARLTRDGSLVVHTASSAWAFELAQLELRIRAGLGDVAPARLRFVVGPLPEPDPRTSGTTSGAVLEASQEDVARAAALVARIADETFRKIVAKAAALSLASRRSDRPFW